MEEIKKRFDEYFKGNIDENSYLHINTVYIRNFIQSEIDLAVSKERERIVKGVEKMEITKYRGFPLEADEKAVNETCRRVINLINTK